MLELEEYVGEEVDGRISECLVDEMESPKLVEDVLSSIVVSFVCASPRCVY